MVEATEAVMRGWRPPVLVFMATVLVGTVAGCSAKSLTGEEACELVRVEVRARTVACTGDKALGETAADSLDTLVCLLEDDDTAIGSHSASLTECLGAIHGANCEEVAVHAESAAYWMGLDFHCPSIFNESGDTGAVQ